VEINVMPRRITIATLAMLLPLSTSLLILEGTLRVTHVFGARVSFSEPNDQYGWRFTPNKKYWAKEEGGRASGRINRDGWRDRDWDLSKRPGLFRVAVVGDSYVEAIQVQSDETFLRIAEPALVAENH
jgi:hypothetical protein